MRFVIVAVGHRQPAWVDTAVNDYIGRLPRDAAVNLIELRPEPRPDNAGAQAVARLLEREAARITTAIPRGAALVALDETGPALTTRAFASQLEKWRTDARDVAFVIGSADGLDAGLKQGAERLLSLSNMTLPHGLARVLLAEQLYRAHSLSTGHPYHRD